MVEHVMQRATLVLRASATPWRMSFAEFDEQRASAKLVRKKLTHPDQRRLGLAGLKWGYALLQHRNIVEPRCQGESGALRSLEFHRLYLGIRGAVLDAQ